MRLAISAMFPIAQILDILKQMAEHTPVTRLTLLFENQFGTMERQDDGDVDIAVSEMVEDQQATYDFVHLKTVDPYSTSRDLAKQRNSWALFAMEGVERWYCLVGSFVFS